jgi:capsule biosynthesis phosphatase
VTVLAHVSTTSESRIVVDLDHTITKGTSDSYEKAVPNSELINKLKKYKSDGFKIAIFTSRNMNSFNNNNGLIIANTIPIIYKWLVEHDVPFDEIWPGKPWCGHEGFYVDDRAIRPEEFVKLSHDEIEALLRQGLNQ